MQRRTLIILDAIDEASGREEILDTLSIVAKKSVDSVHVLVSSELKMDIEDRLRTIETGRVCIGDRSLDNIHLHIQRSIRDDLKIQAWDDSRRRAVEDSLISGASLGSVSPLCFN